MILGGSRRWHQQKKHWTVVPFVESEEEIFLKTVIPSRKATKEYVDESDENT